MSSGAPVEMYWDGACLRPADGWVGRARREFTAGEVYHMAHQEPRSTASHNHYFAAVESAWKNLPEMLADRFPTDDHLRKFALTRTGWHNIHTVTCGTRADALRCAALARTLDEYAVVDVPTDGTVVTVYTAKTQSARMGKADFQKSKDDVLEYLSHMIGVAKRVLTENAGKAA